MINLKTIRDNRIGYDFPGHSAIFEGFSVSSENTVSEHGTTKKRPNDPFFKPLIPFPALVDRSLAREVVAQEITDQYKSISVKDIREITYLKKENKMVVLLNKDPNPYTYTPVELGCGYPYNKNNYYDEDNQNPWFTGAEDGYQSFIGFYKFYPYYTNITIDSESSVTHHECHFPLLASDIIHHRKYKDSNLSLLQYHLAMCGIDPYQVDIELICPEDNDTYKALPISSTNGLNEHLNYKLKLKLNENNCYYSPSSLEYLPTFYVSVLEELFNPALTGQGIPYIAESFSANPYEIGFVNISESRLNVDLQGRLLETSDGYRSLKDDILIWLENHRYTQEDFTLSEKIKSFYTQGSRQDNNLYYKFLYDQNYRYRYLQDSAVDKVKKLFLGKSPKARIVEIEETKQIVEFPYKTYLSHWGGNYQNLDLPWIKYNPVTNLDYVLYYLHIEIDEDVDLTELCLSRYNKIPFYVLRNSLNTHFNSVIDSVKVDSTPVIKASDVYPVEKCIQYYILNGFVSVGSLDSYSPYECNYSYCYANDRLNLSTEDAPYMVYKCFFNITDPEEVKGFVGYTCGIDKDYLQIEEIESLKYKIQMKEDIYHSCINNKGEMYLIFDSGARSNDTIIDTKSFDGSDINNNRTKQGTGGIFIQGGLDDYIYLEEEYSIPNPEHSRYPYRDVKFKYTRLYDFKYLTKDTDVEDIIPYKSGIFK